MDYDADRVLLVKPNYKDGWDIPGGYVEPGESPHAAAVREVVEELGVSLPVDRLLVVDWAPHPAEGDKNLFVFDGGRISPEQYETLTLGADEIEKSAFHDTGSLSDVMPDRLARRIALAHSTALDDGTTYAQHVQPAGDEDAGEASK